MCELQTLSAPALGRILHFDDVLHAMPTARSRLEDRYLAGQVDPDTALKEFVNNGQDGLDGLLAALDGGFEVSPSPCHEHHTRVS